MRVAVGFVFYVCLLGVGLFSQAEKPRPKFSDYPVQDIYRGEPAPPVLSQAQRKFRTMIRRGANFPVQFAGHYTVPRWGCGAGCTYSAIVDSLTGRVHDAPFHVSELPGAWEEKHMNDLPARMEVTPESRLMKINGCPNERDCGFYDYLMIEGKDLRLLRKQVLPKEFQ